MKVVNILKNILNSKIQQSQKAETPVQITFVGEQTEYDKMKGCVVQPDAAKPDSPFHVEDFFPYYSYEGEKTEGIIPVTNYHSDAVMCDISKLRISNDELLNLRINSSTIMSDEQKELLLKYQEKMKDPGLGIRNLHEQGITGKGVKLAIIDQPLSPHQEYNDRIIHNEDINCRKMGMHNAQMHGASVASIAVGKDIGVAPDADLVYFSAWQNTKDPQYVEKYKENLQRILNDPDSNWNTEYIKQKLTDIENGKQIQTNKPYTDAINRILELNKKLPDNEQISIISVSWEFDHLAPDYSEVMQTILKAQEQGVFVLSTNVAQTHGIKFNGADRNPFEDVNKPDSYQAGAFWKDGSEDVNGYFSSKKDETLLIPMDHRTVADFDGNDKYRYEGNEGGMSWATPYLAGVYVLAKQVKPDINPQEFYKIALETSDECHNNDTGTYVGRLLNPLRLIDTLKN